MDPARGSLPGALAWSVLLAWAVAAVVVARALADRFLVTPVRRATAVARDVAMAIWTSGSNAR